MAVCDDIGGSDSLLRPSRQGQIDGPRRRSGCGGSARWDPGGRAGAVGRAPCARLARSRAFGRHALAWRGGQGCLGPFTRLARWAGAAAGAATDAPPLWPVQAAVGCRRWGGGRRWGGAEAAVGAAGELPAALVDRPVMRSAQQGQVGQVGRATLDPVHQVVAFAPGQGPITVGEDAAAVAHGQGGPLGAGDDPAGPPDLQGLAGGAAQDRGQQDHGRLQPLLEPHRRARVEGHPAPMATGLLAGDQDPEHRCVTGQPPTGLRPAAPQASTSASSLEPVALPGGRPAAATAGPAGLGRPGGAGGGLGWPGRPGARSGRSSRRATPVGSGELVFGSMVATYQLDTRRQAPARACAQLFRANSIGQSRPRAEGAGPRAATHRARYCLGFRPPPKTLCQVCAHGSDPPREPNFQTNCRGPERPTVPGNWWPASEVIWKSTSIPASELVVRNEAPRRQPPPRAIPGERGACGPPVRRPQSAELHHLNRYAWA
jgi:hypothetical protein